MAAGSPISHGRCWTSPTLRWNAPCGHSRWIHARRGLAKADIDLLADIVTGAYARIGTFRSQESWLQAAPTTRRALRLLKKDQSVTAVAEALHRALDETWGARRTAAAGAGDEPPQTKGREADTTILLLSDSEGYGYESEPFSSNSRLLHVVMTRAAARHTWSSRPTPTLCGPRSSQPWNSTPPPTRPAPRGRGRETA